MDYHIWMDLIISNLIFYSFMIRSANLASKIKIGLRFSVRSVSQNLEIKNIDQNFKIVLKSYSLQI
jgi:hypothetical protein